ncbi:cyclic nucleotide-binding protein [Pilimelia terevasa]|uniref:cyclic nucleotide-binding protein n=1 Tax=Pilimelia terevasa TaxID=53372 RepID=UPI001664F51C|nr:cyclic nucleotide-binding protein [Pilimelia terevasa]
MESRTDVWQVLAGHAPDPSDGPGMSFPFDDPQRDRARPVLRAGVEQASLVSVRGEPYVLLRSPEPGGRAHLVRLSADEAALTALMDGTRSVNQLVAEFARLTGRLAAEQVVRVIADLAANGMLDRPAAAPARRPATLAGTGRGLLAALRGRRMVVADVDGAVTAAHRVLGWLLRRPVAIGLAAVALVGVGLFGWTWSTAAYPLFQLGGSYVTGILVLLLLHVLALVVHECGHALAAKHAGREVGPAGVLLYFGVPAVFVDTTDVWLAGRGARLRTVAAGPAATLVLAGAAQLAGLAAPPLAPVAFALAFVCYFQTVVNLCPLLPLDGHYLLSDWLELPNLRVRGQAALAARLRGKATAWRELDGDGRLVTLYGLLGAGYLLVVANLAVRLWRDRLGGLALGLWPQGPGGRLLLAGVLLGAAAPLLYPVAGWGVRLLRRRAAGRREAGTSGRRLAALRGTILAQLPDGALEGLASRATWRYPAAGEQVGRAGQPAEAVLAVVAGVAEARTPGDVAGTIRQRVGPGGLIALASVLRGTPSAADWHVGPETVLLSLPPDAVAAAMSPLPEAGAAERTEAEALFADTPALEWLPEEDRFGLAAAAAPVFLNPGQPVTLTPDRDAVVIASGEVTLPDGRGLRRGTLIGPLGDGPETEVAVARTPVRLWSLAVQAGAPLLVSAALGAPPADPRDPAPAPAPRAFTGGGIVAADGAAPRFGPHPTTGYPPLAAPPGPPPPPAYDRDRRFQRHLWWLVYPVLVLAAVLTGAQALPTTAWAELPDARLLLTAEKGTVRTVVAGTGRTLDAGDRVYLAEGDRVTSADHATATFTYRGGARVQLCAGGEVAVGALRGGPDRAADPAASLTLSHGTLVADTTPSSAAYPPLALTVYDQGRALTNAGPARFSTSAGETAVVRGGVLADGAPLATTPGEVSCDLETGFPTTNGPTIPATFGPTGTATPTPTATPSPTPSPTPSATPTPTPTAAPSRTTAAPSRPPVADRVPPRVSGLSASPGELDQGPPPEGACKPETRAGDTATVTVSVSDNADGALSVTGGWSTAGAAGEVAMSGSGGKWTGTFRVGYAEGHKGGGKITITVTATDKAGNTGRSSTAITLNPCKPG